MKFPKKVDETFYKNLTEAQKTGILLHSLGERGSKKILAQMKDSEVVKAVSFMNSVKRIPHWVMNRVMQEYYDLLSEKNDQFFDQQNELKDYTDSRFNKKKAS